MAMVWCCVLLLFSVFCSTCSGATNYLIGVGIADVTGPAAGVNMMGYANPSQISSGIHLRQHARAFIIADVEGHKRTVSVIVEACMISHLVKMQVIKQLQTLYGDTYTDANVAISGTHTHSTPGGFQQYLLFDITSLGFIKETTDALVAGIVQSIKKAHQKLQPGDIYINKGELLDSNINRSPTAYLNNPAEERAKYKYNVEKEMTVLKLVDANNKGMGMISWFPVHCTSMNNTNDLVSTDNKGYASLLFEKDFNPGSFPGEGKFVAAFAQADEGDVSPNTKGPHCIDTGLPCDLATSTCNGKVAKCIASGPGKDMFESTKIIGHNQYQKAMELYNNATIKLSGPVDYRHTFVDMTNYTFNFRGQKVTTCTPAMGFSFAAGTTDGPGAFDFKQGDTKGNPLWNIIRNFLHKPSVPQAKCHTPKPILLDTGEMKQPYMWQPEIVDIQIFKIGQLAILPVPGEFTTMSGRRLRDAVIKELGTTTSPYAVITGLANTYADYITTYEEYQIQRYEGASTIFGPHTHAALVSKYVELARAISQSTSVLPGPSPPNLLSKQLTFLPPVLFDKAPFGKKFGDVIKDVAPCYEQGNSVKVSFVSGHPRNDLQTDGTFLTVEQQQPDKSWHIVFKDSAWETRFSWKHTSFLLGESQATISWEIPANQTPGIYRIRHIGHQKSLFGKIMPFQGVSSTFRVLKPGIRKNLTKKLCHHQKSNRTPKGKAWKLRQMEANRQKLKFEKNWRKVEKELDRLMKQKD